SRDTAVFKVYPNPTNDVITIASGQNDIEQINLYNMQGQMLLNKKTSSATAVEVDLSAYASGIYLLKVNNSQTIRVVKN
ncbi:MAG: T9SS type A sorting domain-containing protein, partial [Nonlabens sp.]|nr:T9SS type A sorting domain-containing protein [Nonlabens sp.]